MRIQPKRIRVFPNPWAAMDAQGRPCGLCMSDPDEGSEPGRMVGAWADAKFTSEIREGEIRSRRQDTAYKYLGVTNAEQKPYELVGALASRDPVTLTLSPYYRERLLDGSLLPADAECARAVGLPYEPAASLFDRLARAAVAKFNTHFDADQNAYELLVAGRAPEPTPVSVPAKAAKKTSTADDVPAAQPEHSLAP